MHRSSGPTGVAFRMADSNAVEQARRDISLNGFARN
jgi:hypothetical protein